MTFHIITIFPEIFDSYFSYGILARAIKERKIEIKIHNLRDFSKDKRKTVDDTPYGGGPGMVLKVEPIFDCIEKIKKTTKGKKINVILFSAKGKIFNQRKVESISKKYDEVVLICGRYEGVDERVANFIADEEISIGKYVLSGGELPAMVLVDSVSRMFEGVLGNEDSLLWESFSEKGKMESDLDYPVYTKPEEFQNWKVPDILLGGNHKEIEKWREEKSRK